MGFNIQLLSVVVNPIKQYVVSYTSKSGHKVVCQAIIRDKTVVSCMETWNRPAWSPDAEPLHYSVQCREESNLYDSKSLVQWH